MDIPRLSDRLLWILHKSVRDAFEEDEGHPANGKKYGVRQLPDWRATADELEAELAKRGEPYDPLPWTQPALPSAPARVFYYGYPKGASRPVNEVHVVQHTRRGDFFVERLPLVGPVVQLAGPFSTVQAALIEAARH
jgi:hypothetical protein